jgi:hypothetical protein
MRFAPAAILAAVLAGGASASPISGAYTQSGPSENLVALFTASGGTSTTNNYSGFVEVIVSGTGNSFADFINDAFYFVPDGSQANTFYQLNVGTSGLPFAGGAANNASNFIVFDDGVGPVTSPYVPAYDPVNNTYHFVLFVGASNTPLTFGVSDGNYADNGGQYNIQVFQLVENTPEPISCIVFGGLLAGGGWLARRRMKAAA